MASSGARQLTVRRLPPQERLITQGTMSSAEPGRLRFSPDSADAPMLLLRTGQRDLEVVLGAIADGARPSAVVTGMGERPDVTTRVRRALRESGVPWAPDPLLFRTALPGYKTARYLQDLDYAPGRDEDPYTPADFADSEQVNYVGRNVVGRAHDYQANAVWAGGFYVSDPDSPWLRINSHLLRVGIAARDGWSDLPILAPVIIRLGGFLELEDQLALVRAMIVRKPECAVSRPPALPAAAGACRAICGATTTGTRKPVGDAGSRVPSPPVLGIGRLGCSSTTPSSFIRTSGSTIPGTRDSSDDAGR